MADCSLTGALGVFKSVPDHLTLRGEALGCSALGESAFAQR